MDIQASDNRKKLFQKGLKNRLKNKINNAEFGYQAITGTILFLLLITSAYPLLYILGASFMTDQEWIARGGVFLFPHHPTIVAYEEVLRQIDLYKSVGVSIARAFIVPIVSVVFCNMVFGYALSLRKFWGQRTLSAFVFFTMVFGGGTIPQYLIRDYTGLLDTFWVYLLPGLLSGWTSLLFKQTFLSTPSSIVEAARIDGASELRILVGVMLPMNMPTVAVMLFMSAIGQWNAWFDAFLYIDSNNTALIPLQLYLKNYFSFNSSSGTAAIQSAEAKKMVVAVVGILPILCIYPFFLKHFTKGVYMGAVKE